MTYSDPHQSDEPIYECMDCGRRPSDVDGRLCSDCGGYLSNLGTARNR
jgi:ribosomal protein L37E